MYYLLFIPRVKQNFQDFLTFQAVQECNDFVRIAFSASQLTFESLLIRSILNRDNFINYREKITIKIKFLLVKREKSFLVSCDVGRYKDIKNKKYINLYINCTQTVIEYVIFPFLHFVMANKFNG